MINFKFPFRLPAVEDTALFRPAASVAEVLQSALESHGVSLNPTLHGLAENLATHLIRPESFLAVPHYWFRKVLPELGDDLGMLWLMSKNCCYIDWARGHDRDTFWVPGGLSTLQGWIRSESLPKRIPSQDSSKRGRPGRQSSRPSLLTRVPGVIPIVLLLLLIFAVLVQELTQLN